MEFGKHDHEETEEERRARHDWEEFDKKVKEASRDVCDKYIDFLGEERNKETARMKIEGRVGLATIGLDKRRELFAEAETSIRLGVDSAKMEKEWNGATNQSTGRPPIGGAVDD